MMNKIAAIYARVSSDRQKEQNTIASQTALLNEFAQAQGWTVPPEWVFEDEGYSGGVLTRPGLERLRDLMAEGQIEAVLVYAPDRLSRNYAYQVLLLEEFSRRGVETIFLKSGPGQTPEEKLLLQFQGMIAEYERAQIAERTRRGKRHYLDELVWKQVLQLLRAPGLIEAELERRRLEHLTSSAAQVRKHAAERELARAKQQADKLLDAYQEDLLTLRDLRERMPELKKRIGALQTQLKTFRAQAIEDERWSEMKHSMKAFLEQLNQTAEKLDARARQKILRLLVKQIVVGKEQITIHHSIPVTSASGAGGQRSSYPLCTRSALAALGQHLPGRAGSRTRKAWTGVQPVRRR